MLNVINMTFFNFIVTKLKKLISMIDVSQNIYNNNNNLRCYYKIPKYASIG